MVDFRLRPAAEEDYDFLYRLHRATMKDIVAQTWGWDEAWQQEHFRQHFDPAEPQIITLRGLDVGALSVVEHKGDVFLQLIQVLPEYQRRGIGTSVIQSVLRQAHRKGKPVVLRVIKANRARRLHDGRDRNAFPDARRATGPGLRNRPPTFHTVG